MCQKLDFPVALSLQLYWMATKKPVSVDDTSQSLLFLGWLRWVLIAVASGAVGFGYLKNTAVSGPLRAASDGVTVEMVSSASRWTVAKSVGTAVGYLAVGYLALVVGGVRAIPAMWSEEAS